MIKVLFKLESHLALSNEYKLLYRIIIFFNQNNLLCNLFYFVIKTIIKPLNLLFCLQCKLINNFFNLLLQIVEINIINFLYKKILVLKLGMEIP
jgi:hypothetical protein